MDLSTERDLLTPTTLADTLLFPSDLPLVLTPSPRDLMPPPRDMLYAYGHYGYGHHGLIYGKRSADAEADPYYGFGYAAVPFGSSTGLDPITQGLDASTQGYAPFAHYGYGHHGLIYGNRSADADAYYGLIGYHGVPFGSSTGLDPITQGLDASTQGYAPYAYGHYGLHGAYLG